MLLSLLLFKLSESRLILEIESICICDVNYAIELLLKLNFSQSFTQAQVSRIHTLSKYSNIDIVSINKDYETIITRIE